MGLAAAARLSANEDIICWVGASANLHVMSLARPGTRSRRSRRSKQLDYVFLTRRFAYKIARRRGEGEEGRPGRGSGTSKIHSCHFHFSFRQNVFYICIASEAERNAGATTQRGHLPKEPQITIAFRWRQSMCVALLTWALLSNVRT